MGLKLLEGQPALLGNALADAEATAAKTGRLQVKLVICAMAMGLYLFLQLTPRLRGWLVQTHERVLQR